MKHALVIGGSSGIGKALAARLVAAGFRVVITGRRETLLLEIQATCPEQYLIKSHDVTDLSSCESLFQWVKEQVNTLDLVVYSSGVATFNNLLDWEKEQPTLQTNVMAAAKIYGLAYQLFEAQGYGHLVGISSIASIRGSRYVAAYNASKAFQASYLESLWMKGKRAKAAIDVTDIQPGFVDTAMALGPTFWMADVSKAAAQIYRAIKRKKRKAYITRRWALIALVLKIVPASLLKRYL